MTTFKPMTRHVLLAYQLMIAFHGANKQPDDLTT